MPTVLLINGFRFFFYSNEGSEPVHIHVSKGDAEGKIWLHTQMEIAYMEGFTPAEIKDIEKIVKEKIELFKQKWNEYFGK